MGLVFVVATFYVTSCVGSVVLSFAIEFDDGVDSDAVSLLNFV